MTHQRMLSVRSHVRRGATTAIFLLFATVLAACNLPQGSTLADQASPDAKVAGVDSSRRSTTTVGRGGSSSSTTPSTSTASGGASSTTAAGSSTTAPGSSTTAPGSSTTQPGTTTVPGVTTPNSSTTEPDSARTRPTRPSTSAAPTARPPTTAAPTTRPPTTAAPTTRPPTTAAPTTRPPSTTAATPTGTSSSGWLVTIYTTARDTNYPGGGTTAVTGCEDWCESRSQVKSLGSYSSNFVAKVRVEGAGYISSGAYAGWYLQYSPDGITGFWMSRQPLGADGNPVVAFSSAAASSALRFGQNFVITSCGSSSLCNEFKAIRWTVTDRFGSGGDTAKHVDLYVGIEAPGVPLASSRFYESWSNVTMSVN